MRPFVIALTCVALLFVSTAANACDGKPCNGQTCGVVAEPPAVMVTANDVVDTYRELAGQAAQKAGAALQACNEGAFRVMITCQESQNKTVAAKVQEMYPAFQEASKAFSVADSRVRLALYDAQNSATDAEMLRAAATIADALEGFSTAFESAQAILGNLGELLKEASEEEKNEA